MQCKSLKDIREISRTKLIESIASVARQKFNIND